MKDIYLELSDEHLRLLEIRQSKGPDKLPIDDVNKFLSDIVERSAEIGDPGQREHLREMARYWANVVYDRTEEYPSTDLLPGPVRVQETRRSVILTAGAIVILMIVGAGFLVFNDGPIVSPTPETPSTSTLPTPMIPSPTASETPASIVATPSPTLDPLAGISIQLQNLGDSDVVSPEMILRGAYAGLEPDTTSIHILLQPLSAGEGRVFPAEENFEVLAAEGEWSIPVAFGDDDKLSEAEQYHVRLAFTSSEDAREELAKGVEQGFELSDLPRGVIVLRQVIYVERKAYEHVQEYRLLYDAMYSHGDFQSADIVSTTLADRDGKDLRRLTNTTTSELQPSLCADNQKIVFVKRDRLEDGVKNNWAIWIMDSDGQNMKELIDDPDVEYEQPRWSPDCRYIAYTAMGEETDANADEWFIYIWDYQDTMKSYKLEQGRYQAWIPGESSSAIVYEFNGTFQRINIASCIEEVKANTGTCESKRFPVPDSHLEGTQPAISPDGQWLAYASVPKLGETSEAFNQDIYIYNLISGGDAVHLTHDPSRDWRPVWSADSKLIYFESGRTLEYSIFVMALDGSNIQLITDETSVNQNPCVGFQDAYFPIETSTE